MKTNKQIIELRRSIVLFFMSITFCVIQSCSTEEALMQNEPTIKTVSREHTIQFLQQNQLRIGNNKVTKTSSLPSYGAILQEEISNSDQYLTVVPLIKTGKREQVRIVLLTVNDTLKSAVFTMYPDDEKKTKDFSGRIMITNLSGEFKNGFRVTDGIIVAQFVKKITEKQVTRTANKITSEDEPIELREVVIPPRKKGTIQINYIFDWSSAYDNSSPDALIWDFEKSGGGGGGAAAADAEAEPLVEEDPCSIASNMTKDAQSITFISAKSNIENASLDGLEHSITLGRDASGNITQSSIRTGGQNAVSVNTSWSGAFASLHNHPNNTQLSAGDIYSSIKLNTMNSNFTTSYILTNGQLYSIVVTDLAAAQAFATAYPADQLPGFNPEFPDFLFNQLQALVTSMGSSVDGKTGAIAFVLNQYNAGITLLKQNNIGEFEPIKPVETTNSDGTKSYTTKPCN